MIRSLRSLIRGMGLWLVCCALAGCQSIRVGPMLAVGPKDHAAGPRAAFGEPTIAPAGAPVDASGGVQQANGQQPAPPPSEAGEGQGIDLETALRLAGVENPTIALAEEAVRARLAERMQARALLFPSLSAGTNFRLHRGAFLNGRGAVTDSNLQSLYYGFGADAKGSGTVTVPGVRMVGHLAEAWYAPQAAQRKVEQSQSSATAVRYSVLGEVGVRYLALAGAQARREALRQSQKELDEVAQMTAYFAKTGQGRQSDAQRSRSEALLLQAEQERAREEVDVASNELARMLDLDPAVRLRSVDLVPPLIELVPPHLTLSLLLDQAVANHPEVAARTAEVQFQETRMRQEKARPWLPTVAVGFSAGDFGGGNDTGSTRLGHFSPRTDLDVLAVWSLQNMGAGNHALQDHARTQWDLAQVDRLRLLDRIRREVTEAHAQANARKQEIELARTRLEVSQRAVRQEMARIKGLLGRPIEALSSINQAAAARQDLVRAMVAYSQAQLQLYVALGNNPGGVSSRSLASPD